MSGDTGRQSSSEVAHEAEDTRAHLASTLEQLRDNLRPENVMEEVVNNARVGASAVADNLASVARQHPIPAVLLAAGSALIMRFFATRGGTPGTTGFETGEGAPASRPRMAGTIPSSPTPQRPPMLRNPSAFGPVPGRAGPAAPSLSENFVAARKGIVDALSVGSANLKRTASQVYETTSSQAGDAMQNVSRYLPHDRAEVRSKLSHLLEEQPLILGVIGLAVGAAIGAALPMTEAEEHLMGSTAHRFRESAQDAARHEVDGLRAAASEAADTVRHSATDNLHDFVKDVGDSAKTVVGKAGGSFGPGTRDV